MAFGQPTPQPSEYTATFRAPLASDLRLTVTASYDGNEPPTQETFDAFFQAALDALAEKPDFQFSNGQRYARAVSLATPDTSYEPPVPPVDPPEENEGPGDEPPTGNRAAV